MFYKTSWLDISYEAIFRNPLFELVRGNIDAFKIFHRHLTPHTSISSSDMQSMSGSALSDLKTRISLFRGNGILEITVDKFTAIFKNAVGQGDIDLIKKCVGSGVAAMTEWLPDLAYREETIRVVAFLALQGEENSRDKFLHDLIGSKVTICADDFGAAKIHTGLKADLENSADKWRATFDVSHSWVHTDLLVVIYNAIYDEGGALTNFEDKTNHAQKIYNDFLAKIGLVPQEHE